MAQPGAHLDMALEGEMTISAAGELRAQLLAALDKADEVDVDLTRVIEVDSAGIQMMVAAKREAAGRQKTLRFCGHSRAVLDALDLTDLGARLGDPVVIHSNA